jgi:hypothetical protein
MKCMCAYQQDDGNLEKINRKDTSDWISMYFHLADQSSDRAL